MMNNSFLDKLLDYFSLTFQEYTDRLNTNSLKQLKTPFEDSSFLNCAGRILNAIKEQEKVIIYGDYDVDGLTATTILYSTLEQLGLKCGFFIPSRYHEGYGLNIKRVSEFKEKGYKLIICVDNGICAFDAVEYAVLLGMEVLIIDHHELAERLPLSKCIFHQNISKFIEYNCSAASLVFFLSAYLLKRYDPYYSFLAGLAVFSDVMPLVENNLILAKVALDNLKKFKFKNFMSLTENKEINYELLNFKIIPALNAIGRITCDSLTINNVCRFLILKDDESCILKYSKLILENNERRKQMVKESSFDPTSVLESEHSFSSIINQLEGLTGLIANRLLNEKDKPILIFAKDYLNEDKLIGSIRVNKNYSLKSFLKKNEAKFISSGGHDKACGIKIDKKDYYNVATLFSLEMEKQFLEDQTSTEDKCIEISMSDLNEENYQIMNSFSPFGEGFKAPVFKIKVPKDKVTFSKNNNAVIINNFDYSKKICLFSVPDCLFDFENKYFDFYGSFKKNVFNNKVSYELTCHDVVGLK